MTGAQFCAGNHAAKSVFPELARSRKWCVRFEFSLHGEAPQRVAETVEATSEANAIRAGLVRRLGSANRALHGLQMLEVRPVL